LDSIEDGSGRVMADRTLAYLRAAFHWQQSRDDNFVSPIIRGMARTTTKELARKRILNDDEIRSVWRSTQQGTFGALIRFLLLTAARRDEARVMTWQEIKGSDWILPATRNKTKTELIRPLSKAVRDLLDTLPRKSDYVFAGRNGAFRGHSRGKTRLDTDSGVTGWRIHDLRRTARSLMSRAGVSKDHAEIAIGHVQPVIVETYDQYEYDEEKRAAFEKLAKLIRTIVEANQ
jgi:integrase